MNLYTSSCLGDGDNSLALGNVDTIEEFTNILVLDLGCSVDQGSRLGNLLNVVTLVVQMNQRERGWRREEGW